MNRTKRKIFETSMKLFAEKGYDATSIEEITSVVGVAKGTLYYHFSSKEEIFNFLIDEGMKLLQNSITIKISQKEKAIDKLKSILLIQLKVLYKYEDFITIILGQLCGHDQRNIQCQEYIFRYLDIVEGIVKDGIESGEIVNANSRAIANEIFNATCMCLLYRIDKDRSVTISDLYKEMEALLFNGIVNKKKEAE